MKNLAKALYGINSITCIFIGVLHTIVHFQDLVTDEVRTTLDQSILVSGTESNIWNLWQGMSLMLGYLLIIIGLLHLFILFKTKKEAYPPIGGSLIMILMLSGVIYVGYYYFGSWQVEGGIGGIIVQSLCIILTLRNK